MTAPYGPTHSDAYGLVFFTPAKGHFYQEILDSQSNLLEKPFGGGGGTL